VYKNFAKLTAYFGRMCRLVAQLQEKRNSLRVQRDAGERCVTTSGMIRQAPATEPVVASR
jgi:hypothetical protein